MPVEATDEMPVVDMTRSKKPCVACNCHGALQFAINQIQTSGLGTADKLIRDSDNAGDFPDDELLIRKRQSADRLRCTFAD
jgi:hypothetical protein